MKIIDIIDLLDDETEIKFCSDKFDCATLKLKQFVSDDFISYFKEQNYELKELERFYYYSYKNKIDNEYHSYEEIFSATIKYIKTSEVSNALLLVLN